MRGTTGEADGLCSRCSKRTDRRSWCGWHRLPQAIVGFTRILQAPNALYVDAVGRIVFGVAVFLAAPASRAPVSLRIFGVVNIVGGIFMPALGVDGYRSLVELKLGLLPRVWAASALLFGALLAYALVPRSRAARQVVAADAAEDSEINELPVG